MLSNKHYLLLRTNIKFILLLLVFFEIKVSKAVLISPSSCTATITSSGPTTFCHGNNVTISGVLNPGPGTNYLWSDNSTTQSIVVSSSGTYSVTIDDGLGCSSSESITITVNPLPSIYISGATTICNGKSSTLSALGGTTYLWSTNETFSSIVVSPTTLSSYSVIGTDSNSCSANATASVTVNSLPVVSISGTTTICNGKSATLSASGGMSYLWSTNETSTFIIINPTTLTFYSVTGTDANACSAITSTSVTVNPLPAVFITGTTVIDNGQNTPLYAFGAFSYLWNTSATTSSIIVNPSTTTVYSVIGTDSYGCSNNSWAVITVAKGNQLYIPDTLSGTSFYLATQNGTKVFYPGFNTPTYGYNGNFLGPTLIINKGDSITLNVKNNLSVPTTVHWHGFHVAPQNDGGPHQLIQPGTTWSPSFKMRNRASTFWYHPHGEGKTEIQVTRGLAGMIIVRDSIEAGYLLPRKYSIDDFPLIVQSKAFDVLKQFRTGSHLDSALMINGTMNPYLKVPKQVVRFRLLNGSADRTYYFGFSDSSSFHLIATDGGLLAKPYTTKRLRLSSGERAEILVDFSSDSIGHEKHLISYSSELPRGIIGADSVGTKTIVMEDGYYDNPLNGADFGLLRFYVVNLTSNPITSIPTAFAPLDSIPVSSATVNRTIKLTPDTLGPHGINAYVEGAFFLNNKSFYMDSINEVVYLNNTEIWTLKNFTMVAHPFHIHDIEFHIVDIDGVPPPPQYQGLKDVILVQPKQTIRFITKFENFANDSVPYMYHCHLLHHEDEGMMGAFLVIDTTLSGIQEIDLSNTISVFPNPSSGKIQVLSLKHKIKSISVYNMIGEKVFQTTTSTGQSSAIYLEAMPNGIYSIHVNTDKGVISKKILFLK